MSKRELFNLINTESSKLLQESNLEVGIDSEGNLKGYTQETINGRLQYNRNLPFGENSSRKSHYRLAKEVYIYLASKGLNQKIKSFNDKTPDISISADGIVTINFDSGGFEKIKLDRMQAVVSDYLKKHVKNPKFLTGQKQLPDEIDKDLVSLAKG